MKIQLEDLHFSYPSGVKALDGIQLEIQTGERIAILGENGAGKTTLAKHLNGLLRPSKGQVLINGQETQGLSVAQMARMVGYVFQNPDEQLFHRTVLEEVRYGPYNLGVRGQALEDQTQQALAILALQMKAEAHPFDLLPSERKLLGLSSVLSMNTPVLVLDEPTLGLDRQGTQRLVKALEWYSQQERTIIVITHDLDFCAEHFHRFLIMSQGRILADNELGEAFLDEGLLAQAGLEPPQLVRLSNGLGWPQPAATVPTFLESFQNHLEKGQVR